MTNLEMEYLINKIQDDCAKAVFGGYEIDPQDIIDRIEEVRGEQE